MRIEQWTGQNGYATDLEPRSKKRPCEPGMVCSFPQAPDLGMSEFDEYINRMAGLGINKEISARLDGNGGVVYEFGTVPHSPMLHDTELS